MRPIEVEGIREKKRKRNNLILGIFLVIILLGSTLGYAVSLWTDSPGQLTNDDIYFDGSRWIVSKNGQMFAFSHSPEETVNVSYSVQKTLVDFTGKPVFIASESDLIVGEISQVFYPYAQRVQRACYETCSLDLPEKDCTENLIVWKISENNIVYQQDNCIFIEGNTLAVDAFLYRILGVN